MICGFIWGTWCSFLGALYCVIGGEGYKMLFFGDILLKNA